MSAWRISPVRRAMATGALVLLGSMGLTWVMAGDALGRRSDGPLANALQATAQLESTRVSQLLWSNQQDADATLRALLQHSAGAPQTDAAIPWVPAGCQRVSAPAAVTRAGVWDVTLNAPLLLLEWNPQGTCADRLGSLAVQAVVGPPFPSPREVARLALQAQLGSELAAAGTSAVVAVWRDGVEVRWRVARQEGTRVAFVDVAPSRLAGPPALKDIRLDSYVTSDGVVAGYIHGGPSTADLSGALAGVKEGTVRALDLPELAGASASVPVLTWLSPADDGGHFALGARSISLSASPVEVSLTVLCSTPWPLRDEGVLWRLFTLWVRCALVAVLLLALIFRTLGNSIWDSAQHTREAWLGLRDDDVGGAKDLERAQRWLETLAHSTQATLVAALGRGEKFWAPAPMKRLLERLRERLKAPPPDVGGSKPPPSTSPASAGEAPGGSAALDDDKLSRS